MISLNEDQTNALLDIEQWLGSTVGKYTSVFEKQYRLVGAAGTGKTTLLKTLIANRDISRWVFSSPTNKSTKVLRTMLSEFTSACVTIYSCLGLRMTQDENRMVLTRPRRIDLSGISVIVIDEAGMVNMELYPYIQEAIQFFNITVLYVCDEYQLPPVGEERSIIFNVPCRQSILTKVERHDNQILSLATTIRGYIANRDYSYTGVVSDNDRKTGVWSLPDQDSFFNRIRKYTDQGAFSDLNPEAVAISWRNKTVNKLNSVVRQCLFTKEERRVGTYLPSDRIVICGPVKEIPVGPDSQIVATTDDQGIVLTVTIQPHVLYKWVQIYAMTVELDTGATIALEVLHESSQPSVDRHLQTMADAARQPGKAKLWKAFWSFKETFHQIKHGYALTTHRLQGSTVRSVFVDSDDILCNHNEDESYRCLYVAYTRPSHKLFVH